MDSSHPPQDLPDDIPLDSSLRTHPKKGLPIELSSTYYCGHISGHARTPMQQAAFESRTQELLNTMTAAQIDEQHDQICKRIRSTLVEIEQDERKWKQEVDDLRKKREFERRAWKRMKAHTQAIVHDPDKMQE